MTERYLGSIISPSPVEPSSNTENSAASGVWNIHDPLIFGQAGDWPDPSVPNPDKFVENLFSCFAYTGTGSSQTITNGIDLDGSGGLIISKRRDSDSGGPWWNDTERGVARYSTSSGTAAETNNAGGISAVTSSGYTLGTFSGWNASGGSYISWTFRKQPKFFDVVTYSGTGSARTISHNLGSVPGMIIVKRTDDTASWNVYHNALNGGTNPEQYGINLNSTGAEFSSSGYWNNTAPTATEFTVGTSGNANASGGTYVAYLFAHNNSNGGFGANGDQDIIKCGSFTTDSSGSALVGPDLEFEPQWVLLKNATSTQSGNWWVVDIIRGFSSRGYNTNTGKTSYLVADGSGAEGAFNNTTLNITPTGFTMQSDAFSPGQRFIYMAIRRGPMRTPTAATSVFDVQKYTGDGTQNRKFTTNFVVDANITSGFTINYRTCWGARLFDGMHETSQTAANYYDLTNWIGYDHNDGFLAGESTNYSYQNASSQDYISYSFSRAPKFFDVVTYSGTGSATTVKHNLEVTPELMIIRNITATAEWTVYSRNDATDHLHLNAGDATSDEDRFFNDTAPTSSVFTVGDRAEVNASSNYYVAYLFATLAGISKVGTYSGTGSDVNVDCGFTSGARFVLVKRADSSGDWYHWDSVNGIVAGNDPYLLFNSDAAQVTNTDYIDPLSSGFTITSNAGSDLNTSGGTYLFLAIA